MLVWLAVLNSMLMSIGQALWKYGVQHKRISGPSDIAAAFLSPYVVAGICIYVLATGLWLYVLNRGELSVVYPIQSLAFVFALLPAALLFNEQLTVNKVLGIVVILLGIGILTRP